MLPAAILAGGWAGEARVAAAVSVFGSIGPTDAGAVADDPALANYFVYDVNVSLTNGDRFNAADLLAQLNTGTFYVPP